MISPAENTLGGTVKLAVVADVIVTNLLLSVATNVYAVVWALIAIDATGVVRVLLVRVCVPAKVAKSPSVSAVLNCAVVPDTVLEPRAIVLLLKVNVPAAVAALSTPDV